MALEATAWKDKKRELLSQRIAKRPSVPPPSAESSVLAALQGDRRPVSHSSEGQTPQAPLTPPPTSLMASTHSVLSESIQIQAAVEPSDAQPPLALEAPPPTPPPRKAPAESPDAHLTTSNSQRPSRPPPSHLPPSPAQTTVSKCDDKENSMLSDTDSVSRRPSAGKNHLPSYGLDAELKAKQDLKYNVSDEKEAASWVQALTGANFLGNFSGTLRSGAVLCQLVNCIKPGTIAKINSPGKPFKERENITNFLQACRSLGVHEFSLFNTDDLYEENNLLSVVRCIHALGGAVQRSVPEFQGPHLGVADTSNAKREPKRSFRVTQTGGLQCAMEKSHIDMTSNQIVRGGC